MTGRSTARPRRAFVALALTIALAVPLHGGTAEAAGPKGWGALGIRVVTKSVATDEDEGVAATARCPRGTKVIGGGAYFGLKDIELSNDDVQNARLAASVPLASKRGWYANGEHATGRSDVRFVVKALCAKGIAYTIRTNESALLSAGQSAGGYIPCKEGETAIGGGAYFHMGDRVARLDDAERSAITSSSITHDRLAWYAHGYTFSSSVARYMTSAAICTTTPFKPTDLHQVVVENVPNGRTIAAAPACFEADQKLLTGGTFWTNDPSGPSANEANLVSLGASSPLRVDQWWGGGTNLGLDGGDLVVRAMCLPK